MGIKGLHDTFQLTPDHEFVVLACDGIWDVMSNEEVVRFIRVRLAERMEPEIVSFHQSALLRSNGLS